MLERDLAAMNSFLSPVRLPEKLKLNTLQVRPLVRS